MASKPKCKYGEKCYRKDKDHKKNFIHPEEDGDTDTEIEENEPKTSKLKRQRTHELSIVDDMDVDDSRPTLKKLRSRTVSMEAKPSASSDDAGPSTSPAAEDDRPDCTYWEKCYRKDPNHLKQFRHPADGPPQKKKRAKAENKIEDGEEKSIAGGYRLKRIGSHYTCTCIGWKVQKNAPNKRTCRHLRDYLGDEFEKNRVGKLPADKKVALEPSQRFSHISISLLLANKYDEKKNNPVNWWISEKLDGVRAFWNGKCFYSRLGNPFYAPKWFTKDLPTDMHLDGELFGGRKMFQSTVSIVKTPECDQWKKIKYHVFDAPSLQKEPFEKRMKAIRDYFDEVSPDYAIYCKQEKCIGKKHIDDELKRVISLGGEGLMIREPGSTYERRRSNTLLKIKTFYDAEAVVVGYDPGKGRFQGKVGALRCKMANGKLFSVGSGLTDKDHNRPPKIGSIITYKFQEYTNSGTPRFPSYLGVRIDMDKPKDAVLPKIVKEDE